MAKFSVGLAVSVLVLTGCSSGDEPAPSVRPAGEGPVTITVPGNASTISSAVAAAKPGDLVLVSPGLYRETVNVVTPQITLRGTDRNTVIIDGEVLRSNAVVVTAANVTIENLTVRNATGNGVLITGMSDANGGLANGSDGYTRLDPAKFPPLQGFHVNHVTSYNNGLYGIYAFDAQHGLIENNYTSGMADSGIYVGQCKPCHTVVRANVAERNAVGYEGTNAGPDLIVTGNRFVGNRVGATTASNYQEAFVPQVGSTLSGNVVAGNSQIESPEQADGGFGIGIGVAGGTENIVSANLIEANPVAGLVMTSSEDLSPKDNQVRGNMFNGNTIDIAYTPTSRAPGTGNCFADNTVTSTVPADLVTVADCAGDNSNPAGGTIPVTQAPEGIPFTEVAAPPSLPTMTDAAVVSAPWSSEQVPTIDVASIVLPPKDLLADQSTTSW